MHHGPPLFHYSQSQGINVYAQLDFDRAEKNFTFLNRTRRDDLINFGNSYCLNYRHLLFELKLKSKVWSMLKIVQLATF